MSKHEKFQMQTVQRLEIHEAEYNPRKISADARGKLKKKIKDPTFGLVQPIIVNKQTMNVVGGHQRLSVLDELEKYPEKDYPLTVAMIDVDEKKEIEINIFLNNTSAQGEWDASILADIKINYDLDFETDLGFDKLDLDWIEGQSGVPNLFSDPVEPGEESSPAAQAKEEVHQMSEGIRERKAAIREKAKERDESGTSGQYIETADYMLTFVFNNNKEKGDFNEKIGKARKEKFLKGYVLDDIMNGNYGRSTPAPSDK